MSEVLRCVLTKAKCLKMCVFKVSTFRVKYTLHCNHLYYFRTYIFCYFYCSCFRFNNEYLHTWATYEWLLYYSPRGPGSPFASQIAVIFLLFIISIHYGKYYILAPLGKCKLFKEQILGYYFLYIINQYSSSGFEAYFNIFVFLLYRFDYLYSAMHHIMCIYKYYYLIIY